MLNMDMQARDIRRHHIERLKEKRKNYWGYGKRTEHGPDKMSPKALGAVVQHPQSCSCWGCGNDRRHFGNSKDARTIQERSQIEVEKKFKEE